MTAVLTGQPPLPSLQGQQDLAPQGACHQVPIPGPGAPHCGINAVHHIQVLQPASTQM